MLRYLLVFVALLALGVPACAPAGEQPRGMVRKPADKLIGTWRSARGAVIFQPNGILIYKGRRHYYAAGNGAIQLKYRHTIRQLPYKIFDGKLTVTESGVDTVYTRE
ncbi:MAG TPA: hypothetical protein VFP33_04505 [Gallionella sp.]|nr:hypothetical protein [Gallionella sp.]